MKIKVGISNRHVHLTEEDYKTLFGDEPLIKRNDLSQEGQFAAIQTVTLEGPKNKIENVRIVGKLRPYTQVELARTDAIKMGLNPPVRDSGDLEGAEEITIINGDKKITKKCCIIATRHIHLTEEDKERLNLQDPCKIKIEGIKPTIIEDVHLKIASHYKLELHLDTDEGNAYFLNPGDEVEIIK